jgi:hypothetical protein
MENITQYYADVKHIAEMVSFVCPGIATSVCTKDCSYRKTYTLISN